MKRYLIIGALLISAVIGQAQTVIVTEDNGKGVVRRLSLDNMLGPGLGAGVPKGNIFITRSEMDAAIACGRSLIPVMLALPPADRNGPTLATLCEAETVKRYPVSDSRRTSEAFMITAYIFCDQELQRDHGVYLNRNDKPAKPGANATPTITPEMYAAFERLIADVKLYAYDPVAFEAWAAEMRKFGPWGINPAYWMPGVVEQATDQTER